MGKVKIRTLKYADDIAVMAESGEELKEMLPSLEKYVTQNRLTVNARKTKIVIFRNGGKRNRGENCSFNGEEIAVVNEFKYLRFWFSRREGKEKHMSGMAGKAQKAANATRDLMKRTGRDKIGERRRLMELLVQSMLNYGVEVWGWMEIEGIEKMEGRYCKMTLGTAINTPKYIWRRELGINGIKYVAREKALRYVRDTMEMKDGRRSV